MYFPFRTILVDTSQLVRDEVKSSCWPFCDYVLIAQVIQSQCFQSSGGNTISVTIQTLIFWAHKAKCVFSFLKIMKIFLILVRRLFPSLIYFPVKSPIKYDCFIGHLYFLVTENISLFYPLSYLLYSMMYYSYTQKLCSWLFTC